MKGLWHPNGFIGMWGGVNATLAVWQGRERGRRTQHTHRHTTRSMLGTETEGREQRAEGAGDMHIALSEASSLDGIIVPRSEEQNSREV